MGTSDLVNRMSDLMIGCSNLLNQTSDLLNGNLLFTKSDIRFTKWEPPIYTKSNIRFTKWNLLFTNFTTPHFSDPQELHPRDRDRDIDL